MFVVSPATRVHTNNQQKTVWPVVFENEELGYVDTVVARIEQGRNLAQELADVLNNALDNFFASLKQPEDDTQGEGPPNE